jgi:ABC-type transport system substrate-binding protein
MTKIISHRGNLNGPKLDCENNPTYIQQAIDEGFDVEIDIWFLYGNFYLGHDDPTYLVSKFWLNSRSSKLWCHVKNLNALQQLYNDTDLNYFWHETDKMTLTSKGYPWLYPNNYIEHGITVELGLKKEIPLVYGICTDYPLSWNK